MTNFKLSAPTTALCAFVAAGPALADVTAQDVWANWNEMLSVYGEGLTIGSETVDGGTVTVNDIVMKIEDSTDVVEATIAEVVFSENGDGTVSVTMSEENPISFTSDGTTLPLVARAEGMEMVVSGTPEIMEYAVTADRYGIEAEPGTYDDIQINTGQFFMQNLAGTYSMSMAETQDVDYSVDVGAITIDVNISESGGSGTVVFLGQIDALKAVVDASVPLDMTEMEYNPTAGFVQGMAVDASYEYGATQYEFNMNIDGDVGQGSASATSGSLALVMNKDGFQFTGSTQAPTLSAFGFEIPFPVEIAMDSYSYNFDVPLATGDAPQDVAAAIALRNLTVNDILWSMVDPGQALPRDPASIVIDLSGKVSPLFDFMDPDQQMQAAMSQELPVELQSLNLNELTVTAAGAEILGTGAFTFDNTNTSTFDGFPLPIGQINLAVNGANGLMDKLIQMGLLPEEQAMGARMMMGMFATPVGDDQLESVLEINDQGHIIANGQRLQ